MKKKFLLGSAIAWLALALALLGILAGALTGLIDMQKFFNNHNLLRFSTTMVKQETTSIENINTISVDSHHLSIKIYFTDDEEITICQYDNNTKNTFYLSEKNGELYINTDSYLQIALLNYNPRLEIYLPKTYAGNINLTSSSGSISCENHASWRAVTLKTTSGSIKLEDGISCLSLSAQSSSGSVKIGEIYADKDIFIKSTSGSLRLENLFTSEKITIETSSGSQKIGELHSGAFKLSATSGSIKAGTIEGGGTISTSSGSINIALAHFTADTAIKATSGSVRVTFSEAQNATLQISTNSGSIKSGEFELLYDKSGRHATGQIGTGKTCVISVKTSSGSIYIN